MTHSIADNLTLETLRVFILRFGLVASAMTIFLTLDRLRQSETGSFVLPVWIALFEVGAAFFLLILAARRSPPRWAVWLPLLVALCVVANHTINYELQNATRGGALVYDTYMFPEYAAQLLRAGANPYRYDMLDAIRMFSFNPKALTNYIRDDLYGGIQHPALSFLLLVPFQALGIPTHYVYVLFFLLSLGLIFWGTPEPLRPAVLLPFLFYTDIITFVLWGSIDIVWVFFLLLMLAAWQRPRWRAVCFGLACAYKVQPWFLLPFLLVRLWHEASEQPGQRLRVLAEFVGVSALTVLVINAPFMLWDFQAWFAQSTSNYVGDFTIFGVGLSQLTVANLVIMPKSAYLLLTLFVLGAAVTLYHRHFQRWRQAGWILPAVVLFCLSHSLENYWVYWVMPLLFALAREQSLFPLERDSLQAAQRWKLSAALLAGAVLVGVGVIVWYAWRPNPVAIQVRDLVRASESRITSLNVHVTNNSDQPLTPRFSVIDTPFFESDFWYIDEGPLVIEPGERASFKISGRWPSTGINLLIGAQVMVSDAYSYNLRAATTIHGDSTALYESAVPNGEYRFWQSTETVPLYWTLQTSDENPEAAQLIETELEQRGLRLTLPTMRGANWNYVRLKTQIMFPHSPISVWVKPPLWANIPPDFDSVYGIDLLANGKRVWVLFGDESRRGKIDESYYWMMPVPRDTWSYVTLDLRQIFADLELPVDDLDLQPINGSNWLIFPRTALDFGWVVAARRQGDGTLQAEVGTVTNGALFPDRAVVVRQAVEHPERVLLWRAERNRMARNYDIAADFARRTLALKPDEARGYIQLGWAQFGMGDDDAAQQSFEQAQALIDAQPERYSSYNRADIYAGQAWLYLRQKACFPAAIMFEQARTTYIGYPYPQAEIEACGTILPERGQ